MDVITLRKVVEEALSEHEVSRWWLYGLATLIIGACAFFGSYLRRKGEHKALKEDVAELTKLTEEVRTQYAKVLENLSHQNRLRIAALERRLQAHQEAYALWRKLRSKSCEPGIADLVEECQRWWDKNCLYLDADSRQAFPVAWRAASQRQRIMQSHDDYMIQKNFDEIVAAGPSIERGVALPPVMDLEVGNIPV